MRTFIQYIAVVLFLGYIREASTEYETYYRFHWEDYCNRTLPLPCLSAGSISFRTYQDPKRCTVNTIVDECRITKPSERLAMYFHVRKFQNESVLVYEGTPSVLRKNLTGGNIPTTFGPSQSPSVAQLLSEYGLAPRLEFEFFEDADHTVPVDGGFDLDFIVLRTISAADTYYCSALRGFIRKKYACEFDQSRVNCPNQYVPTVDATNSVTEVSHSDHLASVCPRYDSEQSSIPLTWDLIISLCVVLVVLGSFVVCCVRSLRRQHPRPQTLQPQEQRNNVTEPDLANGHELYTLPGNSRKVIGAPPSYDDVMADMATTPSTLAL